MNTNNCRFINKLESFRGLNFMSATGSDTNPLDDIPFIIGDWEIDPRLGCISGLNSESGITKLEPQVMAVLLCLVKQQNQVVSREYIEEQAWPNRVVGYDSSSTAIIKLRKALNDDSKNSRYIETIPKRGYRLIAKVTPSKADSSEIIKHVNSNYLSFLTNAAKPGYQYLQLIFIFLGC